MKRSKDNQCEKITIEIIAFVILLGIIYMLAKVFV